MIQYTGNADGAHECNMARIGAAGYGYWRYLYPYSPSVVFRAASGVFLVPCKEMHNGAHSGLPVGVVKKSYPSSRPWTPIGL
jgi:hypothetical protein